MAVQWRASYFLVVLIWGSSFAVIEIALQAFSSSQVAMWRALVGAAFGAAVLFIGGLPVRRLAPRAVAQILLLAALTSTASITSAAAQQRGPSGVVAVLFAAIPLLTIVISRVRGVATPTAGWLGVCLGTAGVGVLLVPGQGLDQAAVLLGLCAASCLALAGVLAAAFFSGSELSGTQLTTVQLLLSGVGIAVLAPLPAGLPTLPSVGPVAALLLLGVLHAGLGNVLFWRVLRQAGPVVATTTYQTVPVVAMLLGVVLLGEPLRGHAVVGGLLVLSGLAMLTCRGSAAGHWSSQRL
jgi:drug/metabolite transporter (DMT)-like permease